MVRVYFSPANLDLKREKHVPTIDQPLGRRKDILDLFIILGDFFTDSTILPPFRGHFVYGKCK